VVAYSDDGYINCKLSVALHCNLTTETQKIWISTLSSGFDMCDLGKYGVFNLESLSMTTRQMHTFWMDEECVLGIMLT
jgi:hypothetical protein